MTLIDAHLPVYQFREIHQLLIQAGGFYDRFPAGHPLVASAPRVLSRLSAPPDHELPLADVPITDLFRGKRHRRFKVALESR
jgi:hypothetical protein